MRGLEDRQSILVGAALLLATACGAAPVPEDLGEEPLAPLQMVDRAQDVADQVEQRYDLLDQP